mmetsp:Transcript_2564/g.2192  ORF Transcript_2564/g.2192 Transcript_2564/m.2192 type:complete len:151 (+) Transcript_2564:291-743(+)
MSKRIKKYNLMNNICKRNIGANNHHHYHNDSKVVMNLVKRSNLHNVPLLDRNSNTSEEEEEETKDLPNNKDLWFKIRYNKERHKISNLIVNRKKQPSSKLSSHRKSCFDALKTQRLPIGKSISVKSMKAKPRIDYKKLIFKKGYGGIYVK